MAVFLPIFLYLPYLIIRFIIHGVHSAIWRMNGTRAAILKNRNGYESSAHVLKIIGRFKLDSVLASNKLLDFVMVHEGFEHPDYVLRENVTLYLINDEDAVFVECAEGQSPWDMNSHSFSRAGQHQTAKKVIILPIDVALQVADQIGTPKGDLIFVHNMARCGSTLFCQMFQATGRYVSYCDPSVLNDLLPLAGHHSYPWIAKRITMVISLMCKQSAGNSDIRGHVIKPMGTASELLTSLYELYPDGHYIFLYRDIIPTVRSIYRLYLSLPYTYVMVILRMLVPNISELFNSYYGNSRFNGRIYPLGGRRLYAKMSYFVLLAHILYQRWRKEGRRFVAVKYEHLVADPRDSLERIFDYCGAPRGLVSSAIRAMELDSQRNSCVSRRDVSAIRSPDFTDEDAEEIRGLTGRYLLPDLFSAKPLDGTITISGFNES